jgi:thiamine biosynthesis lipoprotein
MNPSNEHLRLSRRSLLVSLAAAAFSIPSVLAFGKTHRAVRKFDPRFELAVDVELAVQTGLKVRRPYLAVWLEDKDGKTVRTISLWVQTIKKGPKYIPDLRRWFRDEQDRIQTDGGDLVSTVSSPTREAGKYTVVWDGKNDKGKLVDQGEYTLCVEAARQHGTYQLITQKVKVESKEFSMPLEGNVEIKGATVEFRKRK